MLADSRLDDFEEWLIMPQARNDTIGSEIILKIGELIERQVAMKEDLAELKAEMRHDRAETAGVSAKMIVLEHAFANLDEQMKTTRAKIDSIEASVEPLVAWRRSGVKLLSSLTALAVAVYWVFGPAIQSVAQRFTNWMFR